MVTSTQTLWLPVARDLRRNDAHDRDWEALDRRLERLNARYARAPWRCFGNEARSALLFRAGVHLPVDQAFVGPTDYPQPSLDRFLIRPSIEPIIYSNWHRFDSWNIDDPWALDLTAALIGRKAGHRLHSAGKPPFGDLPAMAYAPLDQAGGWLEAVNAARHRSDLTPLRAAALIHAIVILYHPMDDGNGRLARAMFHGALRSLAGIDAPFLSLGPVSYILSYYLLGLTRRLSQSGDWAAYLDGAYHVMAIAIANQELFEDDDALESLMADPSS